MKRKNKQDINTRSLLIVVALILVNFISYHYFFRIDLTADQRYSLSKATKNILKDLDQTITITAYFTEDMPPRLLKLKNEFKDLLVEYNSASDGNVLYEFVNPNEDQEKERQAMQSGVRPAIINAREKDQVTQKKVYLGAVIRMGEEKDIIPLIQKESTMEYDLSSSIKKLSVKDKPQVGYLQGHGEPPPGAIQQVQQQLNILYDVVPVDLSESNVKLKELKTIAIVAPSDTIPEDHFRLLDFYLAQGGNLFIALNRVEGNMNNATGSGLYTGLSDWLGKKGIQVEERFVVDASCGNVSVRQQQMGFTMTSAMPFPYLPIITNFADHPITKNLESVLLPFASPVNFTGDTSIAFTPIAKSSKKSGLQQPPVYFDVDKRWTDEDFNAPEQTVAAVAEGLLAGDVPSSIVIIGNGSFPVSGEGQQAQQLQPDNVSLMVNSIDWLTDETGLIDLRTKEVTSRPLDQISDSKKAFLRWLNFLLPIIIIILYGIFNYQRRRTIRKKRMEEGYV